MFVQGGMTPFEALRSGTLHGAQYLGLDGDVGSVEVGKLADLVILEPGRDPLTDIRNTQHVKQVVANGRIYDANTMNEVGPNPRPRLPFYWEQEDFGGVSMIPGWFGTIGTCVGCGHAGMGSWATP